ncbi:MAG: hypothetical protein ACYCQJ_07575 [Nitrososphaerales archaeon]
MSNESKLSANPPSNTRPKKKGIQFYGYFSLLFSFSIACAAILWEVFGYYPQYYFQASFVVICMAAVVGYVILTRTIKI